MISTVSRPTDSALKSGLFYIMGLRAKESNQVANATTYAQAFFLEAERCHAAGFVPTSVAFSDKTKSANGWGASIEMLEVLVQILAVLTLDHVGQACTAGRLRRTQQLL